MKFHVVEVLSCYIDNKEIDDFHASMFHGYANRGGSPPTETNHRLAFDVDRPLRLHKNAFNIADVFAPEFKLVVSSRVREALEPVPNLQLEPVQFQTLHSFPYAAGDFSFWEKMRTHTIQQKFIYHQKNDPRLNSEVGQYFHLVAPTIGELKKSHQGLKEVPVEVGPSSFRETETFLVSAELLEKFPAYASGGTIMNDDLFTRIEPFIDWTYFTHSAGAV